MAMKVGQSSVTNAHEIARINELRNEGTEVNLFVGRIPSETLPESKNTLEKWVSLDLRTSTPIDPSRIHLIIDCNEADEMRTIQCLFHSVIIDTSTTKFFNEGTLDHFISLIEKKGNLVLPFETQFISLDDSMDFFKTNHFMLSVGCKKYMDYLSNVGQFKQRLYNNLTNSEVNLAEDCDDLILNTNEYKKWETEELILNPGFIGAPTDCRISCFIDELVNQSGILPPTYLEEKEAAREFTKNYLLKFFDQVQICHQAFPFVKGTGENCEAPYYYFHATERK